MVTVSAILTCSLIACGEDDDADKATTEATTEVAESTIETSQVAATTESPETDAPETVPETEPETEPETKDPTQEWVDTVYSYLAAGEWEQVYEYAGSSQDIQNVCAEYRLTDWSYFDYDFGYLMTTSEGKHLGVALFTFADSDRNDYNEVNIFISENEESNYGLKDTGYNDTVITYQVYKDGTIKLDRTFINHHLKVYDSDVDYDVDEDAIINGWHV